MKRNILIVDDNRTNLYMLKSLLEEEGFEVIEAENGKAALDKAQAHPPDLIVSDILMPVMDGYTLCRQCKLDERLKKVPFVFYTATYTEPKDERFALSLGADRFVLKPEEPETLVRILKEVWEGRSEAGAAAPKPLGEEMEFFRQYGEILFSKLEKKMLDVKTANQMLTFLEEQYRLTFENITDVVWTIDTNLVFQKMSPSVERMLGYKPQYFIGRSVVDLLNILDSESMERVMTEIGSVLGGQAIQSSVYRFVARDGTLKVGEISGSPIFRNDEIIGMVCVTRDITKRAHAEEAVRRSEKKYRDLFDFFPLPVYEMDFNARLVSANRAVYETFRGTEEDLKRDPNAWQILSPEDIDRSRKNIERLLKGEKIEGTEYNLKRLDGSVFPAIVISSVMYDEGKPVGLRGAVVDITERKRAEEERQAALAKMQELEFIVNNSPVTVWLWKAAKGWPVEYVSDSVTMYGYTPDDLTSGRIAYASIVHPDDLSRVVAEVERYTQEGRNAYTQEYRIFTKSGEVRWIDDRTWVRRKSDGSVTHYQGIALDITDRKRVVDALRKNEARFRSYFELPLIGIAIISTEKGWLEVNSRLSEILGYSWQELKLKTWDELTYPDDLAVGVEQFNRVLAGKIDNYVIDKRFIRKNGEVIWTSLAVGCVRKQDGAVDYFVVLMEDISERKESVAKLRKSLGAIVQAIALTVETRDPYTAGHQRRVANLAQAIASEMNLSGDQIEGLRMAGMIHDLGKISVPAEILSKPGKLSENEFALIKTHAQAGYEILKDIDFPWPIARMVLEHHERLNGSGYPHGLTGDELLIESRILSVADVVEAIASHRPYRSALGLDAALNEIEKNRGIIYDADVVDACLRLFKGKNYQLATA